jgi:hypothetical protein
MIFQKVFTRMPKQNGFWDINPRIHGVIMFRRDPFWSSGEGEDE